MVAVVITLFLMTAVLYAVVMLAPPEERAKLYLSPRMQQSFYGYVAPEAVATIIRDHGLNDPFPVQYARWAIRLLQGEWGWSPALRSPVTEVLIVRAPVTIELIIYSLVLFIPLGLVSGAAAGANRERGPDHRFRIVAFVATSIPPFVLALVLLSIFYVGLHWFLPGRIDPALGRIIRSGAFQSYTGMLTVDGLLNGRLDITLEAARHLVLPVVTLSLAHWAMLGRITRALMIEELGNEYVMAARARGVRERAIVWRHALRNALTPVLTSTALSAATLVTGAYVVEAVFNLPGLSELITRTFRAILAVSDTGIPDVSITMGVAIYSVLLVSALLLILDILHVVVDPRMRRGLTP